MKRSGSQSSASSHSAHSATWTEKNEFPSYEDLFYRPPIPENPGFVPRIINGLVYEDENEAPLRALLDEMRDWYEEQSEEAESRLYKPLPPPPVEESDEDDAIQKPFGAARALRKVIESNVPFLSTPSTPPLRLKTSVPSTPSSISPGPKTPTTTFPFSVPRRPFADVPQSPLADAFADSPCPSPPPPAPPLQSSVRARSSSLPLCPSALKAVRSERSLRRPPPPPPPPPLLKPSSKSLMKAVGEDHVLLHPGFNKSFSAPSTPTAAEFMTAMPRVHPSPYSTNIMSHLATGADSHFRTAAAAAAAAGAATHSRWSLSTAAQDDDNDDDDDDDSSSSNNNSKSNPPPSPPWYSTSQPDALRKGLPRSPSRLGLGLGLSFAKFDIMKLVRFPSRAGNRKRLVIKGVQSGEERAVQSVKEWCEVYGAVDRLSQKTNGEIHVHFRNRAVADRVCRTHTNVMIVGAGVVSLSYTNASKQK